MFSGVCFKIASEVWEFEQIARLNHRTFAQEIPQHPPRPDGVLVDPFHEQNTYVIGVDSGEVVAMLAIRARRPFSLDAKLPRLDEYLPPAARPCELRLLAIEPARRRSRITSGLFLKATEHCLAEGFDLAVISGTLRQLHLYRHLGFVAFGPVVGTAEAPYQPMYLNAEGFRTHAPALLPRPQPAQPLNFIPGPVDVSPRVREAYARPPISHRGQEFVRNVHQARRRLCELTGAAQVQLLSGPGTLANDAIAGQLSLRPGRGLVVAQGEFGERLIDHASRFDVLGGVVRCPWGRSLDPELIDAELSKRTDIGWVWLVHCETSSGVLNDLPAIKAVCRRHGVDLCLDCISSIGTIPLDLREVCLASASSGKGLASVAGLSMVFHAAPVTSSTCLPRVLDLGLYEECSGVPYTFPSNPLAALLAALDEQSDDRYRAIAEAGFQLRTGLKRLGLPPVADECVASPAVATIVLPAGFRSMRFGRMLEANGVLAAYRSHYLRARNAVQFCLMGHRSTPEVDHLLDIVSGLTTG